MIWPAPYRGLGAATPGAQQLITAAAAKYGVDPNLALAVAKQESGYNQAARSSAGAIGIMQLILGFFGLLGRFLRRMEDGKFGRRISGYASALLGLVQHSRAKWKCGNGDVYGAI